MCRRGMWNFFRIELRHIDLCKNFQVSDKIKLPSYAKVKELIEQEEKKTGVQRKRERKLSVNTRSSFNSQMVNLDENNNAKELKEFLEDYKKKTKQNENNEISYFKIEPKD